MIWFHVPTQFQPNKIDLAISTILAIFLPILAGFLFQAVGALIPMIIYYGLAWGLVKWRRGSTGYFNKLEKKYPSAFFLNLILILTAVIFGYFSRITHSSGLTGVLMTALIWAPVNAASEQLLWIYLFESWDVYGDEIGRETQKNGKKYLFTIIGLIMFTIFVGTIHTFFWIGFLHVVDSANVFGIIFVMFTSVSGFIHIIAWRQSNQMIFTFIPHFLLNLIPTLYTGYSILPYLFPWKREFLLLGLFNGQGPCDLLFSYFINV